MVYVVSTMTFLRVPLVLCLFTMVGSPESVIRMRTIPTTTRITNENRLKSVKEPATLVANVQPLQQT